MNRLFWSFSLLLVCVVAFGQEAAQVVQEAAVAQPVPVQEVPEWLDKVLAILQGIPVLGPIVTEILKYLGVFAVITTSLTAFLMTALRALVSVFNLAKLVDLAVKVKAFEDSKVMYYLKYFSLFNAPKKVVAVEEKKVG